MKPPPATNSNNEAATRLQPPKPAPDSARSPCRKSLQARCSSVSLDKSIAAKAASYNEPTTERQREVGDRSPRRTPHALCRKSLQARCLSPRRAKSIAADAASYNEFLQRSGNARAAMVPKVGVSASAPNNKAETRGRPSKPTQSPRALQSGRWGSLALTSNLQELATQEPP